MAPPLTWRLGPRAQRELVVDHERAVDPVGLRSIWTRIDDDEIRPHPHDGHGLVGALIADHARLDIVAFFLVEHDRLERDDGPAEEITADAGRQTRHARDERDPARRRVTPREEQHGSDAGKRATHGYFTKWSRASGGRTSLPENSKVTMISTEAPPPRP